jgi:hypothetical protein
MIDLTREMLGPYEGGHAAIVLSGRSLSDLTLMPGSRRVGQLMDVLRSACRQRGLHLIAFSRLRLDAGTEDLTSADRATVESDLNPLSLLARTDDSDQDVIRQLRGLAELVKAPLGERRWGDGKPMRYAVLLEFGQHLLPQTMHSAPQSEAQMLAAELLHTVAQSVQLHLGGNYIIVHMADCVQLDTLVASVLRPVRLPAPDEEEKEAFLAAAMAGYPKAQLADGLDQTAAAKLSARTSNFRTHQMVVAAHLEQKPITAADLFEHKQRDVEDRSEGTLRLMDTRRVRGVELCGQNIEVPRQILMHFARGLLQRDARLPANVLLCGPPSFGKTDLALLVAQAANVPSYEMLNAKAGIVGESERRARLQQQLIGDFGGVFLLDEITEAVPVQRNDHDLDSGASRAVLGALLQGLSDSSRQGRVLLVACSNVPWRIGEAMRSRFIAIPVLRPARLDYPLIVASLARRVDPTFEVGAEDERLHQAAYVFYGKSVSPREMLGAMQIARVLGNGRFDLATVEEAAEGAAACGDRNSILHSELAAIQACSNDRFFPWARDPEHYDWPEYLEGLVDERTGEVNRTALQRRCEEFRGVSNV